MKRLILAAMLATGLAGAAHADDALKSAIAGEHRAAASKARDAYRTRMRSHRPYHHRRHHR